MVKADFFDAALIMSYAFGSKFPLLKKYSDEDIRDFRLASGVFDEATLSHHYIALIDDNIVGILHLDTHKQQISKSKTQINYWQIIRRYGLIRSIFSGISMLLLHYDVPEGECIVDYIAVHPDFRGHGIGTKLLEFGEAIAKTMEGISRYTLHVIGKNVNAMRLYKRYGFEVIESNKQGAGYIFTRVKVNHKMAKQL